MPLISLKRQGNWIQVSDIDGDKHWIYGSLVTSRFQCLAVKSRWVRIRTGPGNQYPLADFKQADRYTPMRRYEMESGWYKVLGPDGQTNWVHESGIWRPVKVIGVSF